MMQRLGSALGWLRDEDRGGSLLCRLGLRVPCRVSLYELAYLPLLAVWLMFAVLGDSRLEDVVPNHGGRMLATLLVAISYVVLCWKPTRRSIAIEVVVVLVAVNALRLGYTVVGMAVTMAWCGRGVVFGRAMRTSGIALAATCAVVMLLAVVGIIPDVMYTRVAGDVTLLRHCLGFGYTTFFSHYWLFLVLLAMFLSDWRPRVVLVVAIVLGTAAIYVLTDSRNSSFLALLAVAGCVAGHRLRASMPSWMLRALAFFARHAFVICFALSALLFLAVPVKSELGPVVHKLLSRRPGLTQGALSAFGVAPFGQKVQWATKFWVEGQGLVNGYWDGDTFVKAAYNYVDCSYFNVLITLGWVPTLAILAGLEALTCWLVRTRRMGLAAVMAIFALHSIFDPQLLFVRYCPFLLLVGAPLCGEGLAHAPGLGKTHRRDALLAMGLIALMLLVLAPYCVGVVTGAVPLAK